jgi:hypothetical protein
MPWLRQLVTGVLPHRSGFNPRPVFVRFMVDKAALWQVSLLVLQFSPVIIIPPMLYTHFNHLSLSLQILAIDGINQQHTLKKSCQKCLCSVSFVNNPQKWKSQWDSVSNLQGGCCWPDFRMHRPFFIFCSWTIGLHWQGKCRAAPLSANAGP